MSTVRSNHLLTDFKRFLIELVKDVYQDAHKFDFSSSGNFYTVKNCAGAIKFDGEHTEWVIPFYIKKSSESDKRLIYCLGIALEFPSQTVASEPNKISLRFFFGEKEDNIQLVFRAELDRQSPDEHGQPHWHFHLSETEIEPQNFESFDQSQVFERSESGSIFSFLKSFHFCMAWNVKSHTLDLNRNTLKWMKDILTYTRSQLEYIHKRAY